ncbi:MAG: NTP transferase domain-containing protein [Frankiaceae bacterium]|nr:NTP transferase domain-containing protein [Frankiaceae bacterium]
MTRAGVALSSSDAYDAIVLAGGTARRLGGVDKPALVVGERSLLDRVLDAVAGAARVVVVGPARMTTRPVTWCRESPPGGGPVAAIAAGLREVTADRVVVLAGDLPFVTPDVISALLDAANGQNGVLLLDADGRDQLLVGAWRADALRDAMPAEPSGARLGPLMTGLNPVRLGLQRLADVPPPWFDCDTEDDLATARGLT